LLAWSWIPVSKHISFFYNLGNYLERLSQALGNMSCNSPKSSQALDFFFFFNLQLCILQVLRNVFRKLGNSSQVQKNKVPFSKRCTRVELSTWTKINIFSLVTSNFKPKCPTLDFPICSEFVILVSQRHRCIFWRMAFCPVSVNTPIFFVHSEIVVMLSRFTAYQSDC
jgi:hypothetical protein